MKRPALLLAIAISCSHPARAEDSGAYLGAGLADGVLSGCTKATSACYQYSSSSHTNASLHLLGGYNFSRYAGVESSLSGLGEYDAENAYGVAVGTVKVSALTLAARGGYKFSSGLSVFGKLGLALVRTQYSPGLAWPFASANNQRSTGTILGFGCQYDFNNTFGIRVSLETVSFSDDVFKGDITGTNLLAIFRL